MEHISWNKLWLHWESQQTSFEDLCMFLFCRKLWVTKIEWYKNQPWIETEPVEIDGKFYGFQAKFLENSSWFWNEIKSSLLGKETDDKTEKESSDFSKRFPNNVKVRYPQLDKIFVYSNVDKTLSPSGKTPTEKLLEDFWKKCGIEIIYITNKELSRELSMPCNFDLAQVYFWLGDKYGFIKNSINPKIITFLQSSECIELPIIEKKQEKKIIDIKNEILHNENKIFLLTGNPGSWKSILMNYIFYIFSWLEKKNEEEVDYSEIDKTLIENNFIPVLINLKNCHIDSLENVILSRKDEFAIHWKNLNFLYLFDGLDELDEVRAEIILHQIYELSHKNTTAKIIMSSRSGNLNIIKAKNYFSDILEYKIWDLQISDIENFFQRKKDNEKIKKLWDFKKYNRDFLWEINDILLLRLFWDTILLLLENTTIIDLFDKKIDLLLNSWEHRKNIEALNLLNSKKQHILELNQDISFEFQKKFQFRFLQSDLQKIILQKFNRLDYASVNLIINYISDLFFENNYQHIDEINPSYIYQHRRYQEYFFTKALKWKFEENSQILREMKIIANREYLEKMFLPYLRREYRKINDLPALMELNFIDLYLWNHSGFSPDEPYYIQLPVFISALTSQNDVVFNELIESENLRLKDHFIVDINALKKEIFELPKDKYDYYRYAGIGWWKIQNLLHFIVLLWKNNKKEIASEYVKNWEEIIELHKKYNFLNEIIEKKLDDWLYYKIVILDESASDVLDRINSLIEVENLTDERRYDYHDYEERWKEELVKNFIKICLKEKHQELFDIIKNFDEYQFICFLEVLSTLEYLPIFVQNTSIHSAIKQFVSSQSICKENSVILFFKKFFGLKFSAGEIEFLEDQWSILRNKRSMDWKRYHIYHHFAVFSYVLGTFSFEKFLAPKEWYYLRYQDEQWLYVALFRSFVELLQKKKSIKKIIREYLQYFEMYDRHDYGTWELKDEISILFAYIFSYTDEMDDFQPLKNMLLKEENNINLFAFYCQLFQIDYRKFLKIIHQNDLLLLGKNISLEIEDYSSYVENNFDLSIFYSKINKQKSLEFFEKWIINSILRHWYHKDYIVSYLLTDAFEIIWKNNGISYEDKKEYAETIFDLTVRVVKITDRDHTWRWPYLLIDIIAKNDLPLAEELKNRLIEAEWGYNFSNMLITSILKWKIIHWFSIEEIEKWMNEYLYKDGEFYGQKFIIYLEILQSDLYTEEEKNIAFEKAYEQCEIAKRNDVKYFLSDSDFRDYKILFKKLCEKYQKIFNIEFNEKENKNYFQYKNKKISEENFINEVKNCTTKRQILWKYQKLNNYKNWIALKNPKSWEILIQKTYKIFGNIDLILKHFLKNYYPHMDGMSDNSKYFKYALSILLQDINTRQEALEYLYKNSWYEWFKNLIEVYDLLWDTEMCVKLFEKYIKFCKFLVY